MDATGFGFSLAEHAGDTITLAMSAAPKPSMEGLVKRVWLLLYTEGGRWTEAEVRRRLGLGEGRKSEIHWLLRGMVQTGVVERKEVCNIDNECSVQYGVVKTCKVPRGVTVDEMWEVLQAGNKA